MTVIHIMLQSAWEQVRDSAFYRPASLESEGFIHCSPAERVAEVAEAYFMGQTDLVLLEIDPQLLTSKLVYEAAADRAGTFPHIYGPLNLEAVVGIADFPTERDEPLD